MKNITLDPGGILGAVLMLAAVMITVVLISWPDSIGSRIGGLGAPALLFGAFGGNYLWDRWFPKKE